MDMAREVSQDRKEDINAQIHSASLYQEHSEGWNEDLAIREY
jgi:hypothetical protein